MLHSIPLGILSFSSGGYEVDNSVVFNDDDSEYLTFLPAQAPTSDRICTLSFWVKRGSISNQQKIITQGQESGGVAESIHIYFRADDKFEVLCENTSGGVNIKRTTTQVFRDPHAWYHFCIRINGYSSGDSACIIEVNGATITAFDTKTNPSSSTDLGTFNNVEPIQIGRLDRSPSGTYADFYLAQFIGIDGGSYDATKFGEYDDNGVWRPIDPTDNFSVGSTAEAIVNSASAVSTTDATTYTFSSVAFGTASATRAIYAFFSGQHSTGNTPTFAEVTIGGIAATQVITVNNTTEAHYAGALFRADVPSGTSGDIVVGTTTAAHNMSQLGVIAWAVTGDHRIYDIKTDTDTSSDTTTSVSLTGVPSNSVILAGRASATSNTHTWSGNVTENIDQIVEGTVRHTGASTATSGGGNFTITCAADSGSDSRGRMFALVLSPSVGEGNNGFYLPMTTANGLGQDYSGNTSQVIAQQNTYVGTSNAHSGDASEFKQLLIADFSAKIPKIDFFARQNAWSGVTVRIETNTGSSPGDATGTLVDSNAEITNVSGSNNAYVTATFPNGGPEVVAGTQYWIVIEEGTFGWAALSPAGTSVGMIGHYQGSSYSSTVGLSHRVYYTGNHFMSRSPTSGAAGYTSHGPSQTTDTCTDNHGTWSPIISYNKGVAFTEGNSRSTTSTSAGDVGGLIGSYELPTAGKYYWEWVTNTVGTTPLLGWRDITTWSPNSYTSSENNAAKFITGTDYNTGSGRILSSTIDGSTSLSQAAYGNFLTVSGGNPLANGTVLGCAYDADNGLAWFSYNNTWVDGNGTDSSSTVKGEIEAGTSGSQAFTTANGAVGEAGLFITASVQSISSGDFTLRTRSDQWTGDCPSGFTALSTKNQAAAVTFAIEDGTAHFQASLWSGNSSSQTVNQSGNSTFTPSMVWIKDRNFGNIGNIFDAVRGSNKGIAIDNGAEDTNANGVTFGSGSIAFTGAGDTGDINTSGRTYVGWQWKGGDSNTAVSESGTGDDAIAACTHRANQTAGFSVVTYQGKNDELSNSQHTKVAHGLGKKPTLIIGKNLAASKDWFVMSIPQQNDAHMHLNTTAVNVGSDFTGTWSDSDTTHFVVGNDDLVNEAGANFVAYVFAEIPGYSKFGLYEGNDNANGPFIPLNFKPAFVMVKNIDATGGWPMYDNARTPFNPSDKNLNADQAGAEYSPDYTFDLLSNGFKIRDAQTYVNDANTYLYMAFAEHPFAGTTPATAR